MPPFLRDGQPIGQRPRSQPAKVYFCQCITCCQQVNFNPLINRFIPGREWAKRPYTAHRHSILSDTNDPPSSDPSDVVEDDSDLTSPELDHPQSSLDTPHDQEHYDDAELLQFENELNTRRKATQEVKGLIFLRPPQLNDLVAPKPPLRDSHGWLSYIEPEHYALDYNRLVNRPILGYLQWLRLSTETIGSLTLSSEMDGRRNQFLKNVEKEIGRIELLKANEWKRQHKEQSYARSVFLDGKITVIDTCMCVFYLS